MTEPTSGQIALIIVAIAFFVVGSAISLLRISFERPWSRLAAKASFYFGILFALAALCWHSISRQSWLPLEDNFDTLIWLALVLSGFVMYVQRRKPLGGLDWFIIPVVILLLIGAALIGLIHPRAYDVRSLWAVVHRIGSYGSAVAFAVAGAAGAMYLLANYRLRHKVGLAGPKFGSLERLEHLTLESVTIGFALLTIGIITGLIEMKPENRPSTTKLVLTIAVWVVYGIVLHSPINPVFRGRRAAMLSIVGFVLTIGLVVLLATK